MIKVGDLYEELKQSNEVFINYNEILSFYPDYYKEKIMIENAHFIERRELYDYIAKNYKNFNIYNQLKEVSLTDDEIYEYIRKNALTKRNSIFSMWIEAKKKCIELCDLIDYIGHYPTTFPIPTEEEKNKKMEEVMKKYDITVKYNNYGYLDILEISSNDVVRIIETLKQRIELYKRISKNINLDMFTNNTMSEEKLNEHVNVVLESLNYFPLSDRENSKVKKLESNN